MISRDCFAGYHSGGIIVTYANSNLMTRENDKGN